MLIKVSKTPNVSGKDLYELFLDEYYASAYSIEEAVGLLIYDMYIAGAIYIGFQHNHLGQVLELPSLDGEE